MRRVYIEIQIKNVFLLILIAITFSIAFSILVVGIGSKGAKGSEISEYNLKQENVVVKKSIKEPKVKVYIREKGNIVEIGLEEYVIGVVAAEMPAEFNIEALKAQAVAARTYALSHMGGFGDAKCSIGKGADLCDTVHCQVYMNKETRFNSWGKNAAEYWSKITEAVSKTKGEYLTYAGKLVMRPYYFAISSGRTENAAEVFSGDSSYLRSVESNVDKDVKNYETSVKFTYKQLASEINSKYPNAKVSASKLKGQISILERTTGGGSVKKIKLGSITITGSQFRQLLNLRSSNFQIKFGSSNIEIICKGYGHGVGMSQWGAGEMAKDGRNYKEILTHYYQGVKMEKMEYLK